jgi:transposase-like protein
MVLPDTPMSWDSMDAVQLMNALKHEAGGGVKFAFDRGLLKVRMPCPHCSSPDRVALNRNSGSPDRYAFNCGECKKRFSVRNGTFFSRSRLSIGDILSIIICFVSDISVTQAASWFKMSPHTIIDWYSFCREVCAHAVNMDNMVIGGVGIKVEIDETLMFKRKYNRGRLVRQHWFFGGYCVEQKRGFIVPVEKRDKATLIPLIEKHIARGSIIESDQWLAYRDLSSMGWTHRDVNHSTNFVNPVTGANTQGIESFWNVIKRKLKFVQGSQGDLKHQRVQEAIYKHQFRFGYRMKFSERLSIFLGHVNEMYSVGSAV